MLHLYIDTLNTNSVCISTQGHTYISNLNQECLLRHYTCICNIIDSLNMPNAPE